MEPILFQSVTVITGEEDATPFVADVLVKDGLIAHIGDPGTVESATARRIDGKGQCLSPGFIDMHAHSDLYLITSPAHEAKISQGCTVSKTRLWSPFGLEVGITLGVVGKNFIRLAC